jgi:hypothetical protein
MMWARVLRGPWGKEGLHHRTSSERQGPRKDMEKTWMEGTGPGERLVWEREKRG